MTPRTLSVIPIEGIGEIRTGDEIAAIVLDAAGRQGTPITDGDCLVVTQKIVSKAEGRMVRIDPSDIAAKHALVESESVRIVRRRGDLVIAETRHGWICANAGIDLSNVDDGWAALLPLAGYRRRDTRLLSARYGARLLNALPPMTPLESGDQALDWLRRLAAEH
mgnify:CR=1 FL=1